MVALTRHVGARRVIKWMARASVLLVGVIVLLLGAAWSLHYCAVHPTRPTGLTPPVPPGEFGKWVNPFIGTGGYSWICANDSPCATVPFGMMRLGPDTAARFTDKRANNLSGYYYGDNKIVGFSHTRLIGTGVKEGGNFRVLPTTASLLNKVTERGWCARFSHSAETACPGYYAVRLPEPAVLVELTSTQRAGVHCYTFSGNDVPHLILDITSSMKERGARDGAVHVLQSSREIEGSVLATGGFAGRYGGLKTYFVARLDQPFSEYILHASQGGQVQDDRASGEMLTLDLAFPLLQAGESVELALALSYVSIENARKNLDAETSGLSFDLVAAKARDAWESALGRIRVTGGTDTQRTIYYTALYHSLQMPTSFTDVTGEYVGFDKAVHKAEGWQYYTDMSLWDTFRTVHPLLTLIAPTEQRDMMRSLVAMCQQGGWLPRWPSGEGYTNSMLGTPADIVMSEAYLKGIRDFDIETAYKSMKSTALAPTPGSPYSGREGVEHYLKFGYCPAELMKEAVSRTIEFGWADCGIAGLAKALGRDEDAKLFTEHSRFYRNLWNPQTQYFQPRNSDGTFPKDFKPLLLTFLDLHGKYTNDYVEGSALQWRWGPFYDPEGLIALFKTKEYFVSELNSFFAKSSPAHGTISPGSYYWHGNEPDIHAAYLFNSAGRPDLTQKWVRWIMENKYADAHDGLDGNDDCGTLSAWYVLSALGFYPVAGTDSYQMGTPLFPEAEVNLGARTLRVVADQVSPANLYVQRAWINDVPLERTWFRHEEIANGGTLRFEMGPTPMPSGRQGFTPPAGETGQ